MRIELKKWQRAQNCEKKYWLSRMRPEEFPENALSIRKYEYGNLTYSEALINIKETIEKFRKIHEDDRILQIGCGPVDVINMWRGCHRWGLDPLMSFYRTTYRLPSSMEINDIKKKGEDLDQVDITFDYILALNVLDHTQDIDRIVVNMKNRIEKGGLVYTLTNTWNRPGFFLRRIVRPLGIDRAHTYTFSSNDIDNLMKKYGFSLIYSHKNSKKQQYLLMKHSRVAILKILACLRVPVFPYVALYTL